MMTPRLLFILTVTQHGVVFGEKIPEQPTQFLDSYLGCYREGTGIYQDFIHKLGNAENIETCRTLAKTKKMKYFAMQNSVECWAGNNYGKNGPVGEDAFCNKKWGKMNSMSKERMQLAGGLKRNAIYRTEEQWYTANQKNKMFKNGTFIGCYWDDVNQAYEDEFKVKNQTRTRTPVDSVEECGKLAEKNKIPYFAVQSGWMCMMSKKMFPHYYKYPPTYDNSMCAGIKPKKISKQWGNFAGNAWMNAIYYTKPSPYWPGAFLDAPEGDDTIRLAWANAYCLAVWGGLGQKFKEGLRIRPRNCIDQSDQVQNKNPQMVIKDNMKFDVKDGLIKCKAKPTMCIGFTGKVLVTNKTLTLEKCGKNGTFQKIQMFDDMTIRFMDGIEFGFKVFDHQGNRPWSGMGDGLSGLWIKTYKVLAAKNEAFLIRSSAPPTPKPTPAPTPVPKMTRLKKAMGWSIKKGDCTIDISSGVPCALSPNYPKKYPDDDSCTIKMTKTKTVKPEVFITEKFFDQLKIGGVKMDGQLRAKQRIDLKKGVDAIEWSSDFYLAGKGWKICKTNKKEPAPPGKRRQKKKTPKCNEQLPGKNKDKGYRGCQDKSKSGRTCMKWSAQKPHTHTRTPNGKFHHGANLINNYCRNPDNEKGIWCYTMDKKKRWEYCNPVSVVKKKR